MKIVDIYDEICYQQRRPMIFLTVEEFAKRMKMHPQTIRKAIRSGKIYASRLGEGKRVPYRISESEIERLYLKSTCEKNTKI